jgi:hypothetical protein
MFKRAIYATLAILIMASQATAGTVCHTVGVGRYTYCDTYGEYPTFNRSVVAAQYAMVNAYREAHGLPRCHWGLIGLLKSAADGLPMC